MKKIISIILSICVLFSICTAFAAEKANPNLGYTYAAVYENNPYSKNSYFSIPAFNINSEDAKKLNEDFIEFYNKLDKDWNYNASYTEYQYGDFVSAVIYSIGDNDCDEYFARTIDIKTGKEVTNSDLISLAGFTENNFVEYIRKLMGNYFIEAYSSFLNNPHLNYDYKSTQSNRNLYNRQYNLTISNELCNTDIPMYIGEDGHLYIIPYIGSMAGASVYRHILDTYYKVSPESATVEPQEVSTPIINVLINEEPVVFDTMPVIMDSRTMVPIRAIFEELGYTVSWNQSEDTAYAVKGNDSITVRLGDNIITSVQNGNSSSYECDVAPQIIGDRILVPLRAIAESSNCKVVWDEKTYTINITNNSNEDDYTILQKFAEEIDSITYNETGKTMYDLKYIIADVTGDGKDNLVIVGVDNGYMGPYRLFEVVSGNVSEISYDGIANNFYLHNGGQYALVNYQGFIRLFNFGTGSKSGYAINLLTYENGAWQFNELSRTNFAGESNKESYTVEGNIVSAEEYNSFNDSIYSNILTADDLSNLK